MRSVAIELWSLNGALVCLLVLLCLLRPHRRGRVALFFSFVWAVSFVPPVNAFAEALGYWQLGDGSFGALGMPVSLWVAWAVMWGPVAGCVLVFLRRFLSPALAWLGVFGAYIGLDLWLMPLMAPLVELQEDWLIGEVFLLAVVLFPALALMHLTWLDRWVEVRSVLLGGAFLSLMFFCVLLVGKGWDFNDLLKWLQNLGVWQLFMVSLVFVSSVPGLWAVWDLTTKGRGTPVPFDPPKVLVTTGVYSWVKAPMQLSMLTALSLWSICLKSLWGGAVVGVALVYSIGFARWAEREELEKRFGQNYRDYLDS